MSFCKTATDRIAAAHSDRRIHRVVLFCQDCMALDGDALTVGLVESRLWAARSSLSLSLCQESNDTIVDRRILRNNAPPHCVDRLPDVVHRSAAS